MQISSKQRRFRMPIACWRLEREKSAREQPTKSSDTLVVANSQRNEAKAER